MRRRIGIFLCVLIISCGAFTTSEDESNAPGGGTSGGPPPPPPPLEGTPSTDELNESFGVFVVPSSNVPNADGTRERPLPTITGAIARAIATSKRVYVCIGTLKESITVANTVPMVGGFDCSTPTWRPSGQKTRVESPSSPALIAENIDKSTRIEGFEFVAPDATPSDRTSIGLRAKNAKALVIASSRIVAGKGAKGLDGHEGIQLTLAPSAKGADGLPETQAATASMAYLNFPQYRAGSAGGMPGCIGESVNPPGVGGTGGYGGTYYADQQTCPPASICGYYWKVATRSTPQGPLPDTPTNGGMPVNTPATVGTDGASATSIGAVTSADGFIPRDGTGGTNGGGGSGGAGGNGGTMESSYAGASPQQGYGATGAGGGAGGCPGLAGTAGKGGGASIGAFLVDSAGLIFDATEIAAAAGGDGGKGAFGSSPTMGGAPGASFNAASAAQAGGKGGRSGVSGNGAGGSSYGLVATQGAPKLTNGATAKAGAAGAGIAQRTAKDMVGNDKTIPASVAGEAKDQLEF